MSEDNTFLKAYERIFVVIYIVVFLIGFIGNALVYSTVCINQSMNTATNFIIMNLAVVDFMVILLYLPPIVLWDFIDTEFFGEATCHIVRYLQSLSMMVSVLTLLYIFLDRWYAICFPLKYKFTAGRTKIAILVIWCVSLISNIPETVLPYVQRKIDLRLNMQCTGTWSEEIELPWTITRMVFLCILPLTLMTLACSQMWRALLRPDYIHGDPEQDPEPQQPRTPTGHDARGDRLAVRLETSSRVNATIMAQMRSRRKTANVLLLNVIVFAVCYLPTHLNMLLRVAFKVQQSDVITYTAQLLCYATAAINPLIYNLMNDKFRRELRKAYFKCFCCSRAPPYPNGSDISALVDSSRPRASCRLTRRAPGRSVHRRFRNTHITVIEEFNGRQLISDNPQSFKITGPLRDFRSNIDLFCNELRNLKSVDTYLSKSTSNIDCKPYYNCYKSGPSYKRDKAYIGEETHSDTDVDYRHCDSEQKNNFNCNRRLTI